MVCLNYTARRMKTNLPHVAGHELRCAHLTPSYQGSSIRHKDLHTDCDCCAADEASHASGSLLGSVRSRRALLALLTDSCYLYHNCSWAINSTMAQYWLRCILTVHCRKASATSEATYPFHNEIVHKSTGSNEENDILRHL